MLLKTNILAPQILLLTAALLLAALGKAVAQPVLDASTPDTFTETSEAIVEAAKNSGAMGLPDVARLEMALNGAFMEAMSYALEKGGPNVTPSDAKRLACEVLLQYDGLSGTQFLQLLQDRVRQQKEASDRTNEDKNAKTAEIITAWLAGEDVPLGDGHSSMEYEVSGPKRDQVDIYTTENNEKRRLFRGYLDETRSSLRKIHKADQFGFYRFDEIGGETPSLQDALFWIPKYKEWISTTINRSETERLPAFVKQLPENDGSNVGPMWLMFNGDYSNPEFLLLYANMHAQYDQEGLAKSLIEFVSQKESELVERVQSGTLQEFLFRGLDVLVPKEVKQLDDLLRAYNAGMLDSQTEWLKEKARSSEAEQTLKDNRKTVDDALR